MADYSQRGRLFTPRLFTGRARGSREAPRAAQPRRDAISGVVGMGGTAPFPPRLPAARREGTRQPSRERRRERRRRPAAHPRVATCGAGASSPWAARRTAVDGAELRTGRALSASSHDRCREARRARPRRAPAQHACAHHDATTSPQVPRSAPRSPATRTSASSGMRSRVDGSRRTRTLPSDASVGCVR